MAKGNFWGQLITQLREERRVSQRQLSMQTRVNRSTLRRIEEGRTDADMDTMERLLNYLGFELEALACETVEETSRRIAAQTVDPERRSEMALQRLLSLGSPGAMVAA